MQFRHVYMNFRQNFSQKKNLSPFQKKTLAETVNCIPKGLRKGNPFHGPFAQLSYIYYIYVIYNVYIQYVWFDIVSKNIQTPWLQMLAKNMFSACAGCRDISSEWSSATQTSSGAAHGMHQKQCEKMQKGGFSDVWFCDVTCMQDKVMKMLMLMLMMLMMIWYQQVTLNNKDVIELVVFQLSAPQAVATISFSKIMNDIVRDVGVPFLFMYHSAIRNIIWTDLLSVIFRMELLKPIGW